MFKAWDSVKVTAPKSKHFNEVGTVMGYSVETNSVRVLLPANEAGDSVTITYKVDQVELL